MRTYQGKGVNLYKRLEGVELNLFLGAFCGGCYSFFQCCWYLQLLPSLNQFVAFHNAKLNGVFFYRWCFDVELVYLCKRFNIPMIEISVNWFEIPGSKVNLFSIPNMLWEMGLMSLGYRTGIWKIYT